MLNSKKMKKCPQCNTSITAETKFCSNCGYNFKDESLIVQENVVNVLRCPACGSQLDSLTAFCPSCGSEILRNFTQRSIDTFTQKISEFDAIIADSDDKPLKGYFSWTKAQQNWWIVLNVFTVCIPLAIYYFVSTFRLSSEKNLSKEELNKATYIKNYVFPSDMVSIMDGILYAKSQIIGLLVSDDNKCYVWVEVWKNKAKELIDKANSLSMKSSKLFDEYNNLIEMYKKIKVKQKNKIIIASIILLIVFLFVIFNL